MPINLLKRLERWVRVERPSFLMGGAGHQKVNAQDILARVCNVSPIEAAFIVDLENGEIDGDVVMLEEPDGGV